MSANGTAGPTASLLVQHAAKLRSSGIAASVVDARGYASVTERSVLIRLGFTVSQQNVPTLLIPIHGANGGVVGYRHRPDRPRERDGKVVKYEAPYGSRQVLDVPPAAQAGLTDVGRTLFITEGPLKADAVVSHGMDAVGINGVWGHHGRGPADEKIVIPDLDVIPPGKTVIIGFDSDVATNPMVAAAETDLASILAGRGCQVQVLRLLPTAHGAKVGLDDFLASHRIDEVLQLARPFEPGAPAGKRASGRAIVVPFSEIEPQPVRWLWHGYIPAGMLTILDGDPGLGKSTLTLDIAARVSTGRPMPDGSGGGAPAAVIVLTAEDDLAHTVRPRLDAAGADVSRISTIRFDGAGGDRPLQIEANDLAAVREAMGPVGPALVIIDPLVAHLPRNVNAHHDQDVRRALTELSALAEASGAAVLAIRHLNKSASASPLYRGGGSIGIIGAARAGFLVAVDPTDTGRRVLAATKANLAPMPPSLTFTITASEGAEHARLAWDPEESALRADDLLGALPVDQRRGQRAEAADFLRSILAAGPMAASIVKAEALEAGISDRTLFRARQDLGIDPVKIGRPGEAEQRWMWQLTPEGRQASRSAPHADDGVLRTDMASFGSDDQPRPLPIEAEYPAAWDPDVDPAVEVRTP